MPVARDQTCGGIKVRVLTKQRAFRKLRQRRVRHSGETGHLSKFGSSAVYQIFLGLGVLALLWLAGDALYSLWVRRKLRRWQAGLAWDEHGVRRDCGPFDIGNPRAPQAILCVHGFNDSPAVFRKMAPRLAQQGYFVRAMRLPGFGERLENAARYGAADWVQAVTDQLRILRKRYSSVYVVGHSLGATVSVAALIQDPSLADAALLLAPALDVSRARSPMLHPETWHRIANCLLVFTRLVYSFFPNDTLDPQERRDPCGTKFSWRRSHDAMFRLFRQIRRSAHQFRTPCFVALACKDRVVDNRVAETFFQAISSPTKILRRYENAAHVLPLDYAWQEVTEHGIEFFKSQTLG